MVLPSLHERLAAAGLGRLEAAVSGLSETAIGFWLTAPTEIQTGPMSKLGGLPDLPARFEWPLNGERPLEFLLQLNLTALRGMEMARLLPRTGVLSFFYDTEKQPWGFTPSDRSGFRVVHFQEMSTFLRRQVPPGGHVLDERALDFFPRISIPHPGSQAGDTLEIRSGMMDWELDRYAEFASEYERAQGPPLSDTNHHFLGYSENIQNDMQLQTQQVCGFDVPAADWVLLLQLDSDPSANLNWGDAGMLYFWIPRQDLRDKKFDRTWVILQCH